MNDFKRIIRECNYDNTYKMALAKSFVELSLKEYDADPVVLTSREFAYKFLKYYWNQTIFFDLVQGSNLKKPPTIYQYTKILIEQYYNSTGSRKPERYEKAETYLSLHLSKEWNDALDDIADAICVNVAWRFLNIGNGKTSDIYSFDRKEKTFTISADMMKILKENAEDLFDLINYRWGMILETFNSSPRINKKVKIMDQEEIKRSSLNKFKVFLDAENPKRKCFICGKEIDEKELSIDHVIPWSYVYSDDLWNLVYVHKSCNSVKSNIIPTQEEIDKLKERNEALFQILKDREEKKKWIDELEIAIEKDYVDKFWIGCKQ